MIDIEVSGNQGVSVAIGQVASTVDLYRTFGIGTPQMVGWQDSASADVTSQTLAIQTALNTFERVHFPKPANTNYLVNSSLAVPSDRHLTMNPGTQLECPSAGWSLSSTDQFGILNCKNADRITIEGLKIRGTKNALQGTTPKLIYHENCDHLTVTKCRLENSAWEGIWGGAPGGSTALEVNRFYQITDNDLFDIGHPNEFVGLPAIQCNFANSIISGNMLRNCGTGIGNSGGSNKVGLNKIFFPIFVGVSTGDGNSGYDNEIYDNHVIIESSANNLRTAFLAGQGPGAPTGGQLDKFTNNKASIFGLDPAHLKARGFVATKNERLRWTDNLVEIHGSGNGFVASAGDDGDFIGILRNNDVRMTSESALSFAFSLIGHGSNGSAHDAKYIVQNCNVEGVVDANNSFAFDIRRNQSNEIKAIVDSITLDGGEVRILNANYFDHGGLSDELPHSFNAKEPLT